jgi:Spy/CpxP family protein refolding chaperone
MAMMGFGGDEPKAPAAPSTPGAPAPGRSVGGGGDSAMRDVLDATKQQKEAIKEVTQAYRDQQTELQKNLQSQLRYLDMSQQAIDTEHKTRY